MLLHAARVPHRARRWGFTLIEILVSILVLGVAFIGVLSLLLTTNRQAGTIVEDGFAAVLAKSVYETVRVGVREYSFAVEDGGTVVRGFLLPHEGVSTGTPPTLPLNRLDASSLTGLRASDEVVFLPSAPAAGQPELSFVYPRPGGVADNAFNNGAGVGKGKNNAIDPAIDTDWGTAQYDIQRVYSVAPPAPPLTAGAIPPKPDAADQYGFAIVIRRAEAPPLLDGAGVPLDWPTLEHLPRGYGRVDGLYEVQILVVRNFDPLVESRRHFPVTGGRFAGLVALGP
jgi:type II secretory pathway pseudopilin PulG